MTIETAAGEKRKPEWPALKHHYGDVKLTEGADGDALDIIINKDNDRTNTPFFIVNQEHRSGKFDEHKILAGFNNIKEAEQGYLDNYAKGWNGYSKRLIEMDIKQFKDWLKNGDHKVRARPPGAKPLPAAAATTKLSGIEIAENNEKRVKSEIKGFNKIYKDSEKNHPNILTAKHVDKDIAKAGYISGFLFAVDHDAVLSSSPSESGKAIEYNKVSDLPGFSGYYKDAHYIGQLAGSNYNKSLDTDLSTAGKRKPAKFDYDSLPDSNNPDTRTSLDVDGKFVSGYAAYKIDKINDDNHKVTITRIATKGKDGNWYNDLEDIGKPNTLSYGEFMRYYHHDLAQGTTSKPLGKIEEKLPKDKDVKTSTAPIREGVLEETEESLSQDNKSYVFHSKVISHTDKSVQDHNQTAKINKAGDLITVDNKFGRKKAGSIRVSMDEWLATEKGPSANPNWNKSELIKEKIKDWPNQDDPDTSSLTDRIKDSIIYAINGVVKKRNEAVNKNPSDITSIDVTTGSANTIFTEDAAEKARSLLRKKLGQVSSGIDPEIMQAGITLAGYHIEKGARTFAQYSKAMIDDLGDMVTPYLKSWYMGVKYDPRAAEFKGMDDENTVQSFDFDDLGRTLKPEAVKPETAKGDENGNTDSNVVNPVNQGGETEAAELDSEQAGDQQDNPDLAGEQPGTTQRPEVEGLTGENGGTNVNAEGGNGGRADQSGISPNGRSGAGGERMPDAGSRAGSRAGANSESGTSDTGKPAELSPAREDSLQPIKHFHIAKPETLFGGGQVARFDKNKAAIELYYELNTSGVKATEAQKRILAAYTGWGSFGQELFQGDWTRPYPKAGWEARDKWLRSHLGESEWKSAQRSITNSHYTDPPTVAAMWDMVKRMGFTGGKVVEPGMGIGNFYGLMPKDIKSNSLLSGIELDELTGGMAKLIYPDANISIKGYQDSKTPDNFYDLAIGNWPFENTHIADRRYQKLDPLLHDYYFLKTIDQVRPGGLIVGITSKGTMDKVNSSIRLAMAKKAELVASFRLPTGAFQEYAGTKVVTDIVILRKRDAPIGIVTDNWIESKDHDTPSGTPVKVNNYYHENPKNVIGTIDYGSGTTSFSKGLVVHRPDDMEKQLKSIVRKVPKGIYSKQDISKNISYITNHTDDRQGAITFKDGELYIVQGEHLALANDVKKYHVAKSNKIPTEERENQLKDLIGLRADYAKLIQSERSSEDTALTEQNRKTLNTNYRSYVQKHGPVNSSFGIGYLKAIGDPFYYTLSALEVNKGSSKKPDWRPATILSRSTSRGSLDIKNPTVEDAFVLARNKSVSPDLAEIAELAKKSESQVRSELIDSGAVFELEGGGIEPTDIYLSGNVREKLRTAVAAVAAGNNNLERNVKALEKVIPKDIPYHEIEARLGASWVNPSVYSEYIGFMLNRSSVDGIKVTYIGGRWKVKLPDGMNNLPEAVTGFGTGAVSFSKLINAAISNQTITVRRIDSDGNQYVDSGATAEVAERIAKIRDHFSEWVWSEPERRVELEKEYNEVRNAWSSPTFDGSFLRFEGMALQFGDSPFNLREHQVNAIWQAVVNRKSLNAHEVGTGKTFTIGGIALESRRYGIAKKPLILAHNANSASVASEIQAMYPGAKILYIDNLTPATIQFKLRQIANDDWDAIVMPHSLIDRMSLTEETLMGIAQEEISALENEAREAAEDDGADFTDAMLDDDKELGKLRSATAKDLVKARNRIIETIKKHGQRASKENAVSFEELGIDMIMVDEAHAFKKPPIVTKMRMKGLNTDVSTQSISLQFLTRYIRSNNNGGNVHLFTGTPITNTITEIYHQMRYIMEENMADVGVDYWDGWFGSFASEVADVELNAAAEYENVTRLASFINVPELRKLAGQYMDVVFSDDMLEMKPRKTKESGKTLDSTDLTELERNELENGRTEGAQDRPYKKIIIKSADLTPDQLEQFQTLQGYARSWRDMDGKTRRQAILNGRPESPVITEGLAEKASFDIRLLRAQELAGQEGNVPDHPDSKASRVIDNALEIYKSDKRATQAIFMGIGISKTATKRVGPVGAKVDVTYPVFSVAHDIIERLVKQGIPRDEIALVSASTSKKKRKQIADAMNKSKIRIVIGSTNTLGIGVNMQKNLRAMHHLDAPWMPGDLEQRNGRGHRQGNQWNTVLEYRYITDRLDGRRWQILSIKQRFIKEFLNSNSSSRIIEGDSASEEQSDLLETFAEAAGDPRVLIKAKLKKKIEKLKSRERMHTFAQADAKKMVKALNNAIEWADEALIPSSVMADNINHVLEGNKGNGFSAKIGNKRITKRNMADEAISDIVKTVAKTGMDQLPIGKIMDLNAFMSWPNLSPNPVITVKINNGEKDVPVTGNLPNIQSLTAALRSKAAYPGQLEDKRSKDIKSLERMSDVAKEPFKQKNELTQTDKELSDLELDMQLNPVPPPSWLRQGAPVDTEIFASKQNKNNMDGVENIPGYGLMLPVTDTTDNKNAELVPGYGWMIPVTRPTAGKVEKLIVTGHRWTNDGYYVMAKDSNKNHQIPYMDAKDSQGYEIYEQHEFVQPEVHTARPANNGDNGDNQQDDAPATVDSVAANLTRFGLKQNSRKSPIRKYVTQSVIDRVSDNIKGDIVIADNFEALPGPVKDEARKQGSDGSDVFGVSYNGNIYINQANMTSDQLVEDIIFHESTHKGLGSLLGDDKVRDAMTRLYYSIGGIDKFNALADSFGVDLSEYAKGLDKLKDGKFVFTKTEREQILMEELLAHIGEKGSKGIKLKAQELIGAIRAWLRSHGFMRLAELGATDLAALAKSARMEGLGKKTSNRKDIRFMVAWHGGPHDHDGFSTDYIGTGEGNQAYGWGLYFSTAKHVANFYKQTLSQHKVNVGDIAMSMYVDLNAGGRAAAYRQAQTDKTDLRAAEAVQNENIRARNTPVEDIANVIKEIRKIGQGKLYRVELSPAEDEYLLWDKPLSEQSAKVRSGLKKLLKSAPDLEMMESILTVPEGKGVGGYIYGGIASQYAEDSREGSSGEKTSKLLRDSGIRGIKYLDEVSRDNKEGTYNYVIFDDADISIEAKFSRRDPNKQNPAEKSIVRAILDNQPVDKIFRAPFSKMLNNKGEFKPGVKLEKTVKNKVINGKTGVNKVDSFIETIRHGVIDRYKTPTEFIDREQEAIQEQRKHEMRAIEFIQALSENISDPNEWKLVKSMLEGEDVGPQPWSNLAAPVRRAIDEMGKDAVDLGLITAETYERNKGAYLHRVYKKYEASTSDIGKIRVKIGSSIKKKIQGSALKRRGMSFKLEQERLLRDAPVDWFGLKKIDKLADKRLVKQKFILLDRFTNVGEKNNKLDVGEGSSERKIKHRVWWPADLAIPSKFAEYDNRGTFEVINATGRNLEVWRDYTKAERESMGEILDARYVIAKTFHVLAHDISTARFFDDISKHKDWTWHDDSVPPNSEDSTNRGRFGTYSKVDWVKVPSSVIKGTKVNTYGSLAGKYIKSELWRDIQGLESMHQRTWWNEVMTMFKMNKTARNPVVHMNNVMSNFVLMDMIDVRVTDLFEGLKEYSNQGDIFKEALNSGAFGHNFISQEIRDNILVPVLEEVINQEENIHTTFGEVQGWSRVLSAIDKAYRGYKKADKWMIQKYQIEDEIFRMATYIRRRSIGDSSSEAAKLAREQFLNYDIRAPWVNAARKTVLPFISYSYRAIPAIATSIAHRPWKLAKYITVMYMLESLSYMLTGDDDEEKEKEKASMDDSKGGSTWMGTPRMVRMPFKDDDNNPWFIDVRRWIPAGDVFDMNQGAVPFFPAWLQMGGPLLIAGEVVANKNTYFDREIYNDEIDTITEKFLKSAGYVTQSMIPSAPWIPGSHYMNQIIEASMGATNWKGIERSFPQTLASSVGIKVQTLDKDAGFVYQKMAIQREERALKFELKQLEKQNRQDKIFDFRYDMKRKNIMSKLEKLREKANDVKSKSR